MHKTLIFGSVLFGLSSCGWSVPAEPPVDVPSEGASGHGWFATPWGIEEVDYVWRNGARVYEGDLVLASDAEVPAPEPGRAVEALLSRASLRWEPDPSTGGVVRIPFEIANTGGLDATVFDRTTARIERAMDHWETYARQPDGRPLVRFVPRSGEPRFVQLQVKHNEGVCFVSLARTGKTRVDADPACRWQTFVHELGHVLTFRHEQKREDRPAHVTFHPARTHEDGEFTMTGGNWLGTPYDSHSIMHYPSCMFALSRCDRSTPGAWVLERTSGARYIERWSDRAAAEVISPTDVCGLRTLYDLPCADTGSDSGPTETTPDPGVTAGLAPMAGTLQSYATGSPLCAIAQDLEDAPIRLAPCDDALAMQRWALLPTRALRNDGSKRCAVPDGKAEGATVVGGGCTTDDNATWRFGDIELVHGASGTCAAIPRGDYHDGQTLVHAPCSGASTERFSFVPDTHALVARGLCLTAAGPGAAVELRACDGSEAQRWIETAGGLGAAGLCMRPHDGTTTAPEDAVEVAPCDGADDQRWGLRGQVALSGDELCLRAGREGEALAVDACEVPTPDQTFVWWPRAACVPVGCAELGATCGTFDDGCGGALACGACPLDPVDGEPSAGELEEPLPADETRDAVASGCNASAAGRSGGGLSLAALFALLGAISRRRR